VRVCLGGTFDPFHVGHEALLAAAARDATELFVGITDGKLAVRAARTISPWSERAARVESFLASAGYAGKLVTRPLTDPYGPAVEGDFDAIAATPETTKGAEAINAQRAARGRTPLRLIHVPHVLAQDLLPISGTRVAAGAISARGKRLTPVAVAVGSANPVKVEAVRRELGTILGCKVQATGHAVETGVAEQPRDDEVVRGARNRARLARAADPGCDYAVGVEAGLMRFPGEPAHVEVQACVVVDRDGWETHGWGPGFHYPAWVTERALRGEMVSAILGPVANDDRIGSTTGAIGYLSDGRLDRTALTQQAILMAFVPRIKRDLYVRPPA
jgi:inosine/xanthosine triphosphatase